MHGGNLHSNIVQISMPMVGTAESVILDRKILDVRRKFFCL